MRRYLIVALTVVSSFLLMSGTGFASETVPPSVDNSSAMSRQSATYNIPTHNPDSTASPAAYPIGCGLTVLISRHGNFIDGDVITGCNSVVASIQHDIIIQRSRWYGWETMATLTPSQIAFNVNNLHSFLNYNCAGTGTHDFRVIGTGQVIPYGGAPSGAQAFDRIDGQLCP
jgi:hypothetical protein